MVRLNVTQKNIDEGRRDGCRCPIALAGLDAGLTNVRVGPTWMHWGAGEQHFSAKLPPEAEAWEGRYDLGARMAPISFDVEPIPSLPVLQKDLI